MQLKWGQYAWASGAVEIKTRQEILVNEGGQRYRYRDHFDVAGYLFGDGQAAITTQMTLMMAALAIPYQNLYLLTDTGGLSATILTNQGSLSGVLITSGPDFPESRGSEYATERKFTFTASADYAFNATQNLLVSFTESLSFSGGDAVYVCQTSLNKESLRFRTVFREPYRVTQHGSAVGFRAKPTIPAPKFPFAKKHGAAFGETAPKRAGNIPAQYTDFAVEWTYEFEWPSPLVGTPNRWIK